MFTSALNIIPVCHLVVLLKNRLWLNFLCPKTCMSSPHLAGKWTSFFASFEKLGGNERAQVMSSDVIIDLVYSNHLVSLFLAPAAHSEPQFYQSVNEIYFWHKEARRAEQTMDASRRPAPRMTRSRGSANRRTTTARNHMRHRNMLVWSKSPSYRKCTTSWRFFL